MDKAHGTMPFGFIGREMNTIKLPQLVWYGKKEAIYPVPNSWHIEECDMTGCDKPSMNSSEIRKALDRPIGALKLKDLARGKNQVVILFDDMSRVTHTFDFVPHILEDLAEAGIEDRNIRFVCATGCHGALTRIDFVKKLGKGVLERFPVYNHNPFGNCVQIGKTKTFGSAVSLNEEVMKCDFKIAISGTVPHAMTGFGGGGKIIFPGVASIESTKYNHHRARVDCLPSQIGMGNVYANPVRLDIEEAAALASLDFSINVLFNKWGDTAQVFAGALKPAYAASVEESKTHYFTTPVRDKDIVIANAFIKTTEASGCLNIAYTAIGAKGGDIVLVVNEPAGQIVHYLYGTFGSESYGPEHLLKKVPLNVNKVIIYTPYPDLANRDSYPVSEKVIFLYKWGEVLKVLEADYPSSANVAVFPYAEMQYTK
jgi:nickel-dependent lactate racemase